MALIGRSQTTQASLVDDRRVFYCASCRRPTPFDTSYDENRLVQRCTACSTTHTFVQTGDIYVPEGFLPVLDGFILRMAESEALNRREHAARTAKAKGRNARQR